MGSLRYTRQESPLGPIISIIMAPTRNRLVNHLASLLGPHLGNPLNHVKNSKDFIHAHLTLSRSTWKTSLSALTLYYSSLKCQFWVGNLMKTMSDLSTTSLLLRFSASMASSVNKEMMTLPWVHHCHLWLPTSSWTTLREWPICWSYYADMFMTWFHGPERLNDFPNHLNSIHPITQFIMETEPDGHLPFLDTDISRTKQILGSYCIHEADSH